METPATTFPTGALESCLRWAWPCVAFSVTDGSCLVVGVSPPTLQGSPFTGNQGEFLLPTILQDTKGL